MKNQTKCKLKRVTAVFLVVAMVFALTACGSKKPEEKQEIQLFVAASLSKAIEELAASYEKENPNTKVTINADGSGKLKTQIVEGFDCNIFFSASETEMAELEKEKLIDKDSAKKVLENQLAIVGPKEYEGRVTGLDNVNQADSIALPYGSVPAGFYARKALIANGMLEGEGLDNDKIKAIEGKTVGEALGGLTISEKDNVSTVISSIAEKSTEVGFAYTSDTNRNDKVKVISKISKDLSGEIVYPIVKIKGKKLTAELSREVDKLYDFLISDDAKKVYEDYGFIAK